MISYLQSFFSPASPLSFSSEEILELKRETHIDRFISKYRESHLVERDAVIQGIVKLILEEASNERLKRSDLKWIGRVSLAIEGWQGEQALGIISWLFATKDSITPELAKESIRNILNRIFFDSGSSFEMSFPRNSFKENSNERPNLIALLCEFFNDIPLDIVKQNIHVIKDLALALAKADSFPCHASAPDMMREPWAKLPSKEKWPLLVYTHKISQITRFESGVLLDTLIALMKAPLNIRLIIEKTIEPTLRYERTAPNNLPQAIEALSSLSRQQIQDVLEITDPILCKDQTYTQNACRLFCYFAEKFTLEKRTVIHVSSYWQLGVSENNIDTFIAFMDTAFLFYENSQPEYIDSLLRILLHAQLPENKEEQKRVISTLIEWMKSVPSNDLEETSESFASFKVATLSILELMDCLDILLDLSKGTKQLALRLFELVKKVNKLSRKRAPSLPSFLKGVQDASSTELQQLIKELTEDLKPLQSRRNYPKS